MNSYATVDDLTDWLEATGLVTPDNADALLRSATVLVARACNRDLYTDVPTTTDAAVLRDATTAQATAWITLGVAPAAAGLDAAPVKTKKIGSATIERDTAGQSEARVAAATEIAPEARQILLAAGLFALDLPVWTSDTDPLADYGLDRPRSIGLRPWSLSQWQNL